MGFLPNPRRAEQGQMELKGGTGKEKTMGSHSRKSRHFHLGGLYREQGF